MMIAQLAAATRKPAQAYPCAAASYVSIAHKWLLTPNGRPPSSARLALNSASHNPHTFHTHNPRWLLTPNRGPPSGRNPALHFASHTLSCTSHIPNIYNATHECRWLLTPNGGPPSGKNLALDFLSWDDLLHRDEGQVGY